MKRFVLKIAFIGLIATQLFAQTGTFVDSRDGREYQTITINNIEWFIENLKYETENSYCPNFSGNEEICTSANFYTYKESQIVCPEGWRLPTLEDWEFFIDELSKTTTIERYSFKKQFRADIIDYSLFKTNPLKIKAIGRVEGNQFLKGDIIDFWTIDKNQNDLRYHMHIMPNSIQGHTHRHHIEDKPEKIRMFPIRCVMEVKGVTNKIDEK